MQRVWHGRTWHLSKLERHGCPSPGSAQSQAGWGFEQSALGEGVPAHAREVRTRWSLKVPFNPRHSMLRWHSEAVPVDLSHQRAPPHLCHWCPTQLLHFLVSSASPGTDDWWVDALNSRKLWCQAWPYHCLLCRNTSALVVLQSERQRNLDHKQKNDLFSLQYRFFPVLVSSLAHLTLPWVNVSDSISGNGENSYAPDTSSPTLLEHILLWSAMTSGPRPLHQGCFSLWRLVNTFPLEGSLNPIGERYSGYDFFFPIKKKSFCSICIFGKKTEAFARWGVAGGMTFQTLFDIEIYQYFAFFD